jgi:ribosomal protein S18 acetylase RimI-like enzyme
MILELVSLSDYGFAEAAELLNRGFADYYVRIELDKAALLHMVWHDGIDASSSRVVLRDGDAVGVALIARRGWSCRLGGMAVVSETRGQGVGKWLMARLIAEARARGERTMVLEVIEQNKPAIHLYHSCGFRTQRRLVSYALAQAEEEAEVALEEVDPRRLSRLVTAHGLPNLPWQVSGESLAQMGPPSRAYKLGSAYVAISDPSQSRVAVRGVVVEPSARRQGQATRLLRAVMANHPGREWMVPALCPEEIGRLFEKLGFELGELAQLQMVLEL